MLWMEEVGRPHMPPQTPAASDGDLVRGVAAGDAHALMQMAGRYRRPLYARIRRIVCDHHIADELLQETFVRLWKHAGTLDPNRSASAWLTTVATRLAITWLRSRRREHNTVLAGEWLDSLEAAPAEDDAAVRLEEVQRAMANIAEHHREALELRVQRRLSYKEMAALWGCSLGTVMSRLHRARAALRAAMGEPS